MTVLLLRRSILTEKLARRGQHIAREYSVDVFEMVRVGDMMDPRPPTIPATMTVFELSDRIAKGDPLLSPRQASLVLDGAGHLAGVITRGDLIGVLQSGTAATTTVLEAAGRNVEVAFPDETLQDAVARMLKRDVGRLPVVDRGDPRRVVGYLGRADILRARVRLQQEEELRERGPARNLGRMRPAP